VAGVDRHPDSRCSVPRVLTFEVPAPPGQDLALHRRLARYDTRARERDFPRDDDAPARRTRETAGGFGKNDGDNGPGTGGYDPEERLDFERKTFCSIDRTLGARTMRVERESSEPAYKDYVENARGVAGPVL
jgi:hypothetical protein